MASGCLAWRGLPSVQECEEHKAGSCIAFVITSASSVLLVHTCVMFQDLDHMRIRLILNLLAVGCLQLTIIRHMIELLHESMQTVPIRNSDSAAEPQ